MASSISLSYVPSVVGSSNCTRRKVGTGSRINLVNRKLLFTRSSIRISPKSAAAATVIGGGGGGFGGVSEVPWLLVPPPSLKNAESTGYSSMAYQFYSLAGDKVFSIHKRRSYGEEEEEELPDDDARVVGSSHGWLSLFNQSTNGDLFLSNPLTRRHIKLPSVDPNKPQWVTRVVISCSPDEQHCRSLMTFTPENRLAFCCPGRSSEWTRIGDVFQRFDDGRYYARDYQDFVYSPKRKLFFCVTRYGDFEAWDLRDPNSPAMTPMVLSFDRDNYPWASRSDKEFNLKQSCYSKRFLVIDEKTDRLFHVRRFVKDKVPCDPLFEKIGPYRTIGFDVHEVDVEKGELRYMDRSLDGLAMFVGPNYSFAVRASEYPELKPDSIYFTDVRSLPFWKEGNGRDNGFFNYHDGTIWSYYHHIDRESVEGIVPSPIWFTPTQF